MSASTSPAACRAMRGDQRDAVAARRLLYRGASERVERDCIGHNTLLDCAFQAARKREPADREHRIAKLQHARKKRRAVWRPSSFSMVVRGSGSCRRYSWMSIGSGMRVGAHRRASVRAPRFAIDHGIALMRVRVHRTFRAAEKPTQFMRSEVRERLLGPARTRSGCLRSDACP